MEKLSEKLTKKAVEDIDLMELLKEFLPKRVSIEAFITTYRGKRGIALLFCNEEPTPEVKK